MKTTLTSALHVENGAQFLNPTSLSLPFSPPVFTVISTVTKIYASE